MSNWEPSTGREAWAAREHGVDCQIIIDISRESTPEQGEIVAGWAIGAMGHGVCGLGLGGPEVGNPPEKFKTAFEMAFEAGLPAIAACGGNGWARNLCEARWHGCARSGFCTACGQWKTRRWWKTFVSARSRWMSARPAISASRFYPSLEEHPLPNMLNLGLNVTLNSDDPPMFSTSLTEEYVKAVEVMGLSLAQLEGLVGNGINASTLGAAEKADLLDTFATENKRLAAIHLPLTAFMSRALHKQGVCFCRAQRRSVPCYLNI